MTSQPPPSSSKATTAATVQGDDVPDASGSTLITNLVASRTSYVHNGVRTGVDYYYRVRAVNGSTDNEGKGAWSLGNANTVRWAIHYDVSSRRARQGFRHLTVETVVARWRWLGSPYMGNAPD